MNYIIVTPAYNESEHIRPTIESVIKQTILPVEWIIVNDGSTDDTAAIVNAYSTNYSWIKLLDCKKEDVDFGVHAVMNFNKGINACITDDWDFVLKLDADLDIDRNDFMEFQLSKFANNAKLGICSGITYSVINGHKKLTKGRPYWRTGGAMKFYRKNCLEQIGGLTPIYGWDGLDEYKAMYNGWTTRTFFELHVDHLGKQRANTRGQNNSMFEKRGLSFYQRGFPIEFIILKSLTYFLLSPNKSFLFLKGFLIACIKKKQRFVSRDEMKFIRRVQYIRIVDSIISKKLL